MKLQFNTDSFYQAVVHPKLSPQDQLYRLIIEQYRAGDEWKENERLPPLKFTAQGAGVTIPTPFSYAVPHIERDGDNFSAGVILYSGDNSRGEHIHELGAIISGIFKEKLHDRWIATNDNGNGFILDDGKPVLSIGRHPYGPTVSVGKEGVPMRSINDMDDFILAMTQLEKGVNVYVNTAIDEAVKRELIAENFDLTLEVRM